MPKDLNVGMAEQGRAAVAAILLLTVLAVLVGVVAAPVLLLVLLVVLAANKDIALFFYRCRGLMFACGALLFHQVYYLYSASAFAWVLLEQTLLRLLPGKTEPTV